MYHCVCFLTCLVPVKALRFILTFIASLKKLSLFGSKRHPTITIISYLFHTLAYSVTYFKLFWITQEPCFPSSYYIVDIFIYFKTQLTGHLPSLSCPLQPLLLCHAVVLAVFLPALHIDPALSPAAPLAISPQEYGWGLAGRGMNCWLICSVWGYVENSHLYVRMNTMISVWWTSVLVNERCSDVMWW